MSQILVKILQHILKQLARLTIWRFKPRVIAITGTVGKTSAKEAIFAVLKNKVNVRKSSGNLNNELGAPLAIIGQWKDETLKLVSREQPIGTEKIRKAFFWLRVISRGIFNLIFLRHHSYPDVLILEYGAGKPGDIKELLNIARPHIGIITAIGEMPVHIEFYSSREALIREKARVVEYLPASGFAILNFDDPAAISIKERTRAQIISFGFNKGADVHIANFEVRFDNIDSFGASFKIEYGGSVVPIKIKNALGKSQAYAAAVATCIGLIFDLNLVEISENLTAHYQPPKHRLNLSRGINGAYVIDDTYNASPLSMYDALETLYRLPAKRKIAVLGDMLELGDYSMEAHKKIGELVARTAQILITVGPAAKFITHSARLSGLSKDKIFSFDSLEETIKKLQKIIQKDDLVLIKASRAMAFDKIIEKIKVL